MARPADPATRFWPKVDRRGDNECWPWRGKITRKGYGHFLLNGSIIHAHRAAFILTNPDVNIIGLDIDHLCHNPACVNPRHLEAVTHAENMRRMRSATSPVCARGHTYTPGCVNKQTGRRECTECRRLRDLRRTQRRREGRA